MSDINSVNGAIHIRVEAAAPAKDGGRSIRHSQHVHFGRVEALREAMTLAMNGRQPFERMPLKMEVHVRRFACRADALNLLNGIADIIQRRCHLPEHKYPVWVLEDDSDIREVVYRESLPDAYDLVISPL